LVISDARRARKRKLGKNVAYPEVYIVTAVFPVFYSVPWEANICDMAYIRCSPEKGFVFLGRFKMAKIPVKGSKDAKPMPHRVIDSLKRA
jgi:hypothetical protein